jgi:hypothetical protein
VKVLALLKVIVTYSEEKGEFAGTVYLLFIGFKSHLLDIKSLSQSLEVFVGEVELFHVFAVGWSFVDLESITCLFSLITSNTALHGHAYEQVFTTL